jgi:hypothetical protein
MESFEFHPERWPVLRVFSRNPLVRVIDRLEMIVVTLAFVVGLVAVPFACALGNSVHDANLQRYTEQARMRHIVTARMIDGAIPGAPFGLDASTVMAISSVNGIEHTGGVSADRAVKDNGSVQIWVDSTGSEVDPPTPLSRATVDAVVAAVIAWTAGGIMLAGLTRAARSRLDRVRTNNWDREITSLVGDDRGRSNKQL